MTMVHNNGNNGNNGKREAKARELIAKGYVRMTYDFDGKPDGASVRNDDNFIYRVDFDLGGRPHCMCNGFVHTGWCKHLTAAYILARGNDNNPEDEEPTDDGYWALAQEQEDRVRDLMLDAGLDYGDVGSAAYALGW